MNQGQLIESNINLVYSVIRKHYPTFINDEDIIQTGRVGLCKAAKNWIQDKGEFSTYAWRCILNEIRLEFRRRMKSPDTLSLDYSVSDADGGVIPFGELLIGDHDIEYIDWGSVYKHLNSSESEVLKLTLLGKNSKEIAVALGFNIEVVRRYLRKIKRLLKEM